MHDKIHTIASSTFFGSIGAAAWGFFTDAKTLVFLGVVGAILSIYGFAKAERLRRKQERLVDLQIEETLNRNKKKDENTFSKN